MEKERSFAAQKGRQHLSDRCGVLGALLHGYNSQSCQNKNKGEKNDRLPLSL